MRRGVAVAIVAIGLLVGAAGAAQAHAVLQRTTPTAGSVVSKAPTQVTLTFGEEVGVSSSDIRVYDDHLHRVDVGSAGHITNRGDTVGVRLRSGLAHGTYSVSWRVISADSHPVSGGFTFSIGAPSQIVGTAAGLGGGSRAVGVLLGAGRFVGYLGLVAGPGVLAFLLIWPAGRRDPRTRRLVVTGLGASVIAVAASFLLEGPYAQGEGLSHLFNSLSLVSSSHYGHVLYVRMGLLALLCAATPWVLRGSRVAAVVAGLAGLGLPATWALAGHGGTGSYVPLAAASESLHVVAVTVWLGGLLVLVVRVLPRIEPTVDFAVLPRFSTVALGCIAAIAVTGTYQELREDGVSWTALSTTTYGKLLLAKIGGIIVIIWLGAIARLLLHGASAQSFPALVDDGLPEAQDIVRRRMRAGVSVEIIVAIAVLVLTSILVNTVPGKDAVADTTTVTLKGQGLRVEVSIDPAHQGPATVDVTVLKPSGAAQHLVGVTGSLSLPSRGISSLPITFAKPQGANDVAAMTSFAQPGRWRLSLLVQTSPIDATTFATNFRVH